jgi:uncharacterized delta-60 repeat protein
MNRVRIISFIILSTIIYSIFAINIAKAEIIGNQDLTFNPSGVGSDLQINHTVFQSDGKIIISGPFTTYNGVSRAGIARLNSDGTLDGTFDPGAGIGGGNGGGIQAIAIQTDNKILVGGDFTNFNAIGRAYIARLNTDGSVDTSFLNTGTGVGTTFPIVYSIDLQINGKIIIAGRFDKYNDVTRFGIARLNVDGSLDESFDSGFGSGSSPIYKVKILDGGKIIIGGGFTFFESAARGHLALINSDGTLDTAFLNSGAGANFSINDIAVQSDGKYLIVGDFFTYNDTTRSHIARINTDGSLDTSFTPPADNADWDAASIVKLQSNGKVLVGGAMLVLPSSRGNLERLNTDGSMDGSFIGVRSGPDNNVNDIAIQADGNILVSGSFANYNGNASTFLIRVYGGELVALLSDTMESLSVFSTSNHEITFMANYGITSNQTFTIQFDPGVYAFDLSPLSITDLQLTDTDGVIRTLSATNGAGVWGVAISLATDTITFTAPSDSTGLMLGSAQIIVRIGTNAGGYGQIKNPGTAKIALLNIEINNGPGESFSIGLPIVDSDVVDVQGYIDAYLHFDIDTGVGEIPSPSITPINCNYALGGVGSICLTHENGSVGTNYTVDFGELSSAYINKSNSVAVDHSDGFSGIINSIYFDLSTNAASGAVVTVVSANGGLQGPGSNILPSIGVSVGIDGITRADGEDIPLNSGVCGFNLPVASNQIIGTILKNSLCDTTIKYCGASSTPKLVFSSNGLPINGARVRMDLAAAANDINPPGTYVDTLTFVATSTF